MAREFAMNSGNMKTLSLAVLCVLVSGCSIAHRIKESDDREAYLRYRTETDRLNFEREKAGMAPASMLTFDEWYKLKPKS